mmetsp:Transcript_24914/g.31763  ORF Transcript_24914/g.31763 Transcript_24914/m.31763 type:complete len:95 (-) Transcript_24914:606-890(-)
MKRHNLAERAAKLMIAGQNWGIMTNQKCRSKLGYIRYIKNRKSISFNLAYHHTKGKLNINIFPSSCNSLHLLDNSLCFHHIYNMYTDGFSSAME